MKPLPRDAWVIARLMSGLSVNGELTTVSESFRPLAERLAETPVEGRQYLWDVFLMGQADHRDDIIRDVANADPEGPAPEELAVDLPPKPHAPVVKMTCAADVIPRQVEWLWHGRVPLGMLTLFAGDPKLGKSYVSLAMAAAVSRGALAQDDAPEKPASVILMSAEDDVARTIVPRLKAAGADLSRVHILESIILPRDDPENRDRSGPQIERPSHPAVVRP